LSKKVVKIASICYILLSLCLKLRRSCWQYVAALDAMGQDMLESCQRFRLFLGDWRGGQENKVGPAYVRLVKADSGLVIIRQKNIYWHQKLVMHMFLNKVFWFRTNIVKGVDGIALRLNIFIYVSPAHTNIFIYLRSEKVIGQNLLKNDFMLCFIFSRYINFIIYLNMSSKTRLIIDYQHVAKMRNDALHKEPFGVRL
ncbi:hypothetical protein ACJX0J_040952, partial [Zea mays]